MAGRRKIYYPEGQIKKGLYTNGKQFMFESGEEYIGPYHAYPTTNEIFTQSSYIKNVSKKLIPYVNLADGTIRQKWEYDKLAASIPSPYHFPMYGKPTPTETDYSVGFFYRFFVKKYHNDLITEVDSIQFGKTQVEHYAKIKIPWKLTGPTKDSQVKVGVLDTNRRIVYGVDTKIQGMISYVSNYIEYARIEQQFEDLKDNSNIIINEGLATSTAYIGDGEVPQSSKEVLPYTPDPGLINIPNGAIVTNDGYALVTNTGQIIVTG